MFLSGTLGREKSGGLGDIALWEANAVHTTVFSALAWTCHVML